jgi:hypothetical protein
MRAFLISQPKAGTYLCSALLAELGMIQTGIHASAGNGYFQEYDLTNLEACRDGKLSQPMNKQLPSFADVLRKIPNNGFAVGHLQHRGDLIDATAAFKRIVLTRPLAEMQASWERWYDLVSRNGKAVYPVVTHKRVAPWVDVPGIFHLTFSDIIDANIPRIDDLQNYLFGEVRADSRGAIEQAKNAPTLTKSRARL